MHLQKLSCVFIRNYIRIFWSTLITVNVTENNNRNRVKKKLFHNLAKLKKIHYLFVSSTILKNMTNSRKINMDFGTIHLPYML